MSRPRFCVRYHARKCIILAKSRYHARMLLDELQLSRLRSSAATAHHRRRFRGPTVRIQYKNGPLDGLESIVAATEANARYLGWCVVHQQFGPLTALYEKTANGRVWTFRGIEVGVQ